MARSKKYSVNLRDFIRGSIATILPIYSVAFQNMGFDWSNPSWLMTHQTAILAFVSYLTIKFLSDETGKIVK